jgi:methyl-accepting chemotaxis protein
MLNKLTIKSKLLLLAIVPLITCLFFAGKDYLNQSKLLSEVHQSQVLFANSIELTNLINGLQLERTYTAGYVGSKGKSNANELQAQRQVTDITMQKYLDSLGGLSNEMEPTLASKIEAQTDKIVNAYSAVQDIRPKIDNLSTKKGGKLFSELNITILDLLVIYGQGASSPALSSTFSSLYYYISAKTLNGVEKAVLNNVFTRGSFNKTLAFKFNKALFSKNVYLNNFMMNTTPVNVKYINQMLNDDAFQEVKKFEQLALDNLNGSAIAVDSDQWQAQMDNALNLLDQGEKHLLTQGVNLTDTLYQSANNAVLITITIIAISLILVFIMMISIIRSIQNSVAALSDAMKAVETDGDFSVRATINGSDELAVLAKTYNQLLSCLDESIQDINRVLGAVSQGDFSQSTDENAKGSLLLLQSGTNTATGSVSMMMTELNKVMNAIAEGNFAIRLNEEVPESFRSKVDLAMETLEQSFSEITKSIAGLAKGDFTQQIHLPTAKGDIKLLIDDVNLSISEILATFDEINSVMATQATGDLTLRINGHYDGSYELLKNAINVNSEQMSSVIRQIQEVSQTVDKNASNLSASSESLSERVQQQAASLEETASALEEITSTVEHATSLTNEANIKTSEVKKQAERGEQVLNETEHAMQKIKQMSNNIASIVELIDSIAFQTNLLALNAAVEAARAGEHGRGFAVVASEVRNLAGRSAGAAKEIKDLVDKTNQEVTNGETLMQSSVKELQKINQGVHLVSQTIQDVNSSAQEQAIGVSQINLAVNSLDKDTQENATIVEVTSETAKTLKQEASQLSAIVLKFKV